ncbi:MAG: alpha/beta hydrolase [Gemmatimonadaceae bacterium]|nr:alpha/beta hydrolase [Gemmatimonadaceae bacterium]
MAVGRRHLTTTFSRALPTVLLGLVLGCAPRHAAEKILTFGNSWITAPNLPYGDLPRQRLDVYRPRNSRNAPVVIFIHGGRWREGAREEYRLLANTLTRRGMVVVIPDIRLFPEAAFPVWIEDAAAAVRWTRANIARYGGDSSHIVVVGHSSGAHIITLLALDARYLGAGRGSRTNNAGGVSGYVSLAGPVDTVWTDRDVQEVMGPREGWATTYPRVYVDGTAAPMLFLHGDVDATVRAGNSVRLAALIRQRGGCAESRIYRNVGHIAIIVALMAPALGLAPVADDVERFVRDPIASTCRGVR